MTLDHHSQSLYRSPRRECIAHLGVHVVSSREKETPVCLGLSSSGSCGARGSKRQRASREKIELTTADERSRVPCGIRCLNIVTFPPSGAQHRRARTRKHNAQTFQSVLDREGTS